LQQLLFLQHKLFIFAATFFFNYLQQLKAIAAGIFIIQQVLFVCRNLFKIAATLKFAVEITKNCSTLLNLQQKLLKISACPLWAAVVILPSR